MKNAITLDETHTKIVVERARFLNQTPEQFLQGLIDAHAHEYSPSPSHWAFDATKEDDLDALFQRARKSTRNVDE